MKTYYKVMMYLTSFFAALSIFTFVISVAVEKVQWTSAVNGITMLALAYWNSHMLKHKEQEEKQKKE